MKAKGLGLWQATLRVGQGAAAPFADALEQDSVGVSMFEATDGDWTVAALYRVRPDAGALAGRVALAAVSAGIPEPSVELARLPAADWLAQAYAGLPPRRIGRFYVHGSHVAGRPPSATLALHIDAATAFGSGEHATTEGCLLGIGRLNRKRRELRRVLDMGSGSGILAIAAAKIWPTARVAAVDIDAEAARVARLNARLNGVSRRVRAERGDGYHAPLARDGAHFDLIIANILARPLIRMAPPLRRRLAPGGIAILSGILNRQAASVLSAHRAVGLRLVRRQAIGDWQTLTLRRP